VSFGGAGPLHACALARALRIPKVLAPNMPGALSAYGILVSDVVRDYSRTLMTYTQDPSITRHFEALEEQGKRQAEDAAMGAVAVRSLDLRYAGQGYELTVPWSNDFAGAFHRLHEQRYGYADVRRPTEVVNVRVRMIARTEPVEFCRREVRAGDGRQAVLKRKQMYYEGEWLEGLVYDRDRLHPGDRFCGPAAVVEYSATTFLPPRAKAEVDGYGNLVIEVGA
jgi:N-methylhydantoinase A